MKSSNNILKIDSILEYYDNPQLLTARDAFDTLYLCLLYDDFPTCKYTAIRISSSKLQDFYSGNIDLRNLFLYPENEKEYFDVEFDNEKYLFSKSTFSQIPENRLTDFGYQIKANEKESIIVNIPTKDKGLFKDIVKKFGWACM